MKSTDNRKLFGTLIGASAATGDIATIPATQATAGDGTASIALAFPPETFIARAAGGEPPRGADMNGFLNLLSSAVQVLQAGYLGPFDATFAAGIGGYPAGAVVSGAAAGTFWVSTADANTTAPGDTGASWKSLFDGLATQAWANGQFLQLAATALQTVTGPVTFSGATLVPTPTDYTKKQALGASDADARYARLTGGNALTGNQTITDGDLNITTSNLPNSGAWSRPISFRWGNSNATGQVSMFANPSDDTYTMTVFVSDGTNRKNWSFDLASGNIYTPSGTVALTSALTSMLKIPGASSPWMQGFNAAYNSSDGSNGTLITLPTAYPNKCLFAFGNDVGQGACVYGTTIVDAGHVRIWGRYGSNYSTGGINLITIGY